MIRGLPVGQTWAVVSDVHANAHALRAALPSLRKADRIVVLGDMLTYGVQPEACMEMLAALVDSCDTDLVLGNHDQLYIDLLEGRTAYYDGLPDWLKEVSDWTLARVDPSWFHTFPWEEQVAHEEVLIAHANPWPYGDWRYLNSEADCRAAADTLHEAGYRLGLFGHTHRPMVFSDTRRTVGECTIPLDAITRPLVVNPGSVGQARTPDNRSSFLWLRQTAFQLEMTFETVDFDVAAHRRSLATAGFSEKALGHLLRYVPRG